MQIKKTGGKLKMKQNCKKLLNISNVSGGVGKSTTAIELATYFGMQAKRYWLWMLICRLVQQTVSVQKDNLWQSRNYRLWMKKSKVEGWESIATSARMLNAEKLKDWKTYIDLGEVQLKKGKVSDWFYITGDCDWLKIVKIKHYGYGLLGGLTRLRLHLLKERPKGKGIWCLFVPILKNWQKSLNNRVCCCSKFNELIMR